MLVPRSGNEIKRQQADQTDCQIPMRATAIHSNQESFAAQRSCGVCRDRRPPMRSSLHASPRTLIMTNYQRGILSTPMKAAVVRAEVPVAGVIPGPERGERALLDLGNG